MKAREPIYLVTIACLLGWIVFANQEAKTVQPQSGMVDLSQTKEATVNESLTQPPLLDDFSVDLQHNPEARVVAGVVESVEMAQGSPQKIETIESLQSELVDLTNGKSDSAPSVSDVFASGEIEDVLTAQMESDLTYVIASMQELDVETQKILMPRSGEKISDFITRIEQTIGMAKFEELSMKIVQQMDPEAQ